MFLRLHSTDYRHTKIYSPTTPRNGTERNAKKERERTLLLLHARRTKHARSHTRPTDRLTEARSIDDVNVSKRETRPSVRQSDLNGSTSLLNDPLQERQTDEANTPDIYNVKSDRRFERLQDVGHERLSEAAPENEL